MTKRFRLYLRKKKRRIPPLPPSRGEVWIAPRRPQMPGNRRRLPLLIASGPCGRSRKRAQWRSAGGCVCGDFALSPLSTQFLPQSVPTSLKIPGGNVGLCRFWPRGSKGVGGKTQCQPNHHARSTHLIQLQSQSQQNLLDSKGKRQTASQPRNCLTMFGSA